MALPNGGGGYQVGDGNLNEPLIDAIPDPVTATTTTTFTPAQILNGLIFVNSGISANVAYTLPTVADLENVLINSDKVGTSFTFRVINLGTGSGTATVTTNTGWTITGSLTMVVPISSGAMMVARKSAAGAWTLYRVA
ncbi:MAG: hypothetical protein ACK528_09460 [Alphaproteobacteria bacterium]|jgi:hypothetical protein